MGMISTFRDWLPLLLIAIIAVLQYRLQISVSKNNQVIESRTAWRDACKLMVYLMRKDRDGHKIINTLSKDEWAEIVSAISKAKFLHGKKE